MILSKFVVRSSSWPLSTESCGPRPLAQTRVRRPELGKQKTDSTAVCLSLCTFFADEDGCVCTHPAAAASAAAEVDAAAATDTAVALRLSFFAAMLRRIRSR